MTLSTARALWGAEAVARALAEEYPSPVTAELALEVERKLARLDAPGPFRAWALSQPWPKFCAVVRVVSGEFAREVLETNDAPEEADRDG